jgi:integrase/recombinase XerD
MELERTESFDWREAVESLRGAYADRTLNNCRGIASLFEQWCAQRGVVAWPASPETVAGYVAALFGRLAASTIRTRLIELRRVHRAAGFADPTCTLPVQLAFRRGLRTYGGAVRQVGGINSPVRDQLMAVCGDDLIGRRDRLMIAVGYDTLARSCELVDLRVEDIAALESGGAAILIRRAKNDAGGEGQLGYLSSPTFTLVKDWLASTGLTAGHLLRAARGRRLYARGLNRQMISHRIKLLARRAGLSPEIVGRLSSHSLRVGAAQDLARSGRSLLEVLRAGRWRDLDSLSTYTRNAQVNVWSPGDGDTFAHLVGAQTRARLAGGRIMQTALTGADRGARWGVR